jgi:phosphatidylserine/phosphatidylglycerophosphate/cardiolipin synthase-like enzyme
LTPKAAGTPVEGLALKPRDRREAILGVIAGARNRLRLPVFRCDDDQVLDALRDALRRDVRVQVLLTRRSKGGRHDLKKLRKWLEELGAEVARYDDPIIKYHAKYIIADEGPAVIATLNFTKKCFRETFDAVLTTHDPAVVQGLKRLFASDGRSPRGRLPHGLPDRLLVGPERARAQIELLIDGARHRIRIIDHKLDDPTMVARLQARRRAGVEIEVLGDGQVGDMASHGKAIIVDRRVAAIGSMALTAMHLDFRREVGVLIDDIRLVSQLDDVFERALRAQPAGAAAWPFPEALA